MLWATAIPCARLCSASFCTFASIDSTTLSPFFGGTFPRVESASSDVAARVDRDDLLPRHAAQVLVVLLLDAGLAHQRGRRQSLQRGLRLHLLGGDRSDVAEHLRGDVALRIGADGLLLRRYARELVGVLGDVEDRVLGHVLRDRDGLIGPVLRVVHAAARASDAGSCRICDSRNIVASVLSPSICGSPARRSSRVRPPGPCRWLSRILPRFGIVGTSRTWFSCGLLREVRRGEHLQEPQPRGERGEHEHDERREHLQPGTGAGLRHRAALPAPHHHLKTFGVRDASATRRIIGKTIGVRTAL